MATRNQKKCAVPYCSTVGIKGFSNFPANLLVKEQWQKKCGITILRPNAVICHSHFQDSCFVTGPFDGARRRLKKHSQPELNLPVIITAARPEIPVNEAEIGDQNDQAMLDLG